jgi:hypothetical protein
MLVRESLAIWFNVVRAVAHSVALHDPADYIDVSKHAQSCAQTSCLIRDETPVLWDGVARATPLTQRSHNHLDDISPTEQAKSRAV